MKKTLWLIIDHPMQLVDAMGIRLYYKDKYLVKLLVSRHHYWNAVDTNEIKNWFDEIHFFPRINFSWILPREIMNILANKQEINNLKIKNGDIFFVFSENVFLEGLLFQQYPKLKRIRLFAEHLYKRYHGVNFADTNKWQEKLISRLWNYTIIPFFSLEPIKYYQNLFDDHAYRINYVRDPEKIFDNTLVLKQNGQQIEAKNQIYELGPLVAKELTKTTKTKKDRVFFFGDSLKKYNQYQIDFTNKCLRYIEKYYSRHKLFYKPHPNDVLEQANIELGQFALFKEKLSSELLFLKYGNKIEHIFSVSSVSLKNALQFGFRNVHAFFKLYKKYDPELKVALTNQFGEFLKVKNFFITNFRSPPKPYSYQSFKINDVIMHLKKLDKLIT